MTSLDSLIGHLGLRGLKQGSGCIERKRTMGRFKTWCLGCLSGGMIAAAGFATAEARPVLVELFTSQGCSSCPPADAFLHELSAREDVIALALHVDYWDYIGWKDSFAKPAFTKRQKAYAKAGGRRAIYTPQMIIAGVDHVVGTHKEDAAILIQRHARRDTGVDLSAMRDASGRVTIRAEADANASDIKASGPLIVYLVKYSPHETVEITRGENGGRTIGYTNVVTDWAVIGEWDMAAPLMMQTTVTDDAPGVVILQHKSTGPVMAAAHLR